LGEAKDIIDTEIKADKKFGKILNPRYIKRGVILFISITLISFTGLFLYQNSAESLDVLKEIMPIYLLLALALVFLDWLIGGLRNHIFIRQTNPGISWRACFDANLANIFMGAVTPSQTGGGPAQMYLLWKRGVRVCDSLAVSIINYVSTVIFFLSSAALSIWYMNSEITNNLLNTLIKSGLAIFSFALLLVLVSLIFPKRMNRIILWFASLFSSEKLKQSATKITIQLLDYNQTMKLFIMKKPVLMPLSLILTFSLYFNKYVIAYVILLGLGVTVPFWSVIAIQAILFFMLYFAPSPGGSGIAEVSIAILMGQIIAEPLIPSFTILHRTFLLLIPAIVGSIIFLRELNKEKATVISTHQNP